MNHWLGEELECDPLQWWGELVTLWASSEFKDCFREGGKGGHTETNSDTKEDYSLVTELGIGPSMWIGSGYWTHMGVDR